MIPNHSPWIKQLNRTRPAVPLKQDLDSDVVIVGGGIAGVTTAYFTLRDTDRRVTLIEADKIAHGATGHNAGQITSYFERPLTELIKEFGFTLAIEGQRAIESAWMLIDQICAETRLQTPIYRFTGYAGLSSLEQVLSHLEDNLHRLRGELPTEEMLIAKEWKEREYIPQKYQELYTVVAQQNILELIEAQGTDYIASLAYQKGCTNSALFSEELIGYLLATHQDRFSLYEESPMHTLTLREKSATLQVLSHTVEAKQVVLCTNGFEHFSIINESGRTIDSSFHHSIQGRIGYMSAYLEPIDHPPTAISYFPTAGKTTDEPTGESYFYLTRRPHEHEGSNHNLISTGGPEKLLPEGADYVRKDAYDPEIRQSIHTFLKQNYNKHPGEDSDYLFCWHGLMGYTPNGIRRIGPEPCNPTLLYNLGCNGVGILPSIYGGKKIARFLNGENLKHSIFDPHDQRCEISRLPSPF